MQGKVLRTIPLTGFGDAEAIEYISRGVYVITDERQQRLVKVRLEDDTRFIDAADAQQLSLGIGLNGNKGFEGWPTTPRASACSSPRSATRCASTRSTVSHTQADKPFAVHVVDDPGRDKRLFVRDLSSLQFDEGTGHLLALSDESRLVVELDTDGEPVSTLSLLRGMHGLKRSVPQAEGVAMDDRGVLYLVSEPNLFYVFSKDEPAQP
ncbi:SdiA-regulated domain-containing protein [Pseudomonas aeruginosa]|nr:SdiA-regulated domain-containing protein [Pseudomonas aeruginosa]